MRSFVLASVVALMASGSVACRSQQGLRTQYTQMRPQMVRGEWGAAASALEASKDKAYKEEDRVMYWLNLGTLYHYAGDYQKSNKNFVAAEAEMQKLWTTSISSEATKFIVSETVQDYGGEEFEKILLYFFTALNAVEQGRIDDALVEARRADEFLKKMQVHYEKEAGDDGKAVGLLYKQDAFILWLVGLFYEMEGSHNDAHLAYKAALRAYDKEYAGKFGTPAPQYLKEDVVRSAYLAGMTADADELKGRLQVAGDTYEKLNSGMSELIVFHGAGEAPSKKDLFIDGRMPDGYVMRIAIPKFEARPFRITKAKVTAAGASSTTVMAEPITTIALRNFEHRLPAIKARAIARAIVKYVATKGTSKAVSGGKDSSTGRKVAGALIGLIGNVASAASEHADLRAWTTLPAAIGVTRMWVPAGQHSVQIDFVGGGARTIPVQVAAGERKIISLRTLQ
ncbi:MAG: hypothetical protein RMA76_40205 [Deltaproteobacteria bacterium]